MPPLTSSRSKKKRKAMCFVLELCVEFPATCNAPVLSQLMGTELKDWKPSYRMSPASAVDCAVSDCVLAPKQMGPPLIKKMKSEVDLRLSGLAANDASV